MSTKHGTSAYPCGKYGTVQVQVLSASAQCKCTVQVQVLILVDNVEESCTVQVHSASAQCTVHSASAHPCGQCGGIWTRKEEPRKHFHTTAHIF